MKRWQRYWLYFIGTIAMLHFIRDISQDLGIKHILSTIFVKPKNTYTLFPPSYWWVFNTYIWELITFAFVLYCLRANSFGKLGYVTIILFMVIFCAWLYYWFFI